MDFNDENSNKRIKTQSEREITMQNEQGVDGAKKGLLLQQEHVQIKEYSFTGEGIPGSNSRYRSKFDFVSSYAEEKKQALNETQYIFPKVKKLADQQLSLISTRDLERNTLKFSMKDDEKFSEVESFWRNWHAC